MTQEPFGRRTRAGVARLAAGMAMLVGLAGCTPEPPLRVGLLAGLSGRGANAAEDGRNGAMLAIEQRNAAGGVHGRALELVVRDNGPTAQSAVAAVDALQAVPVEAIVGPFISSVAMAVLPQIDAAHLLMLSPTATATALAGRDDFLLRLNPTTQSSAGEYARQLYQRGQRRVALAVASDPGNAAYALAWRDGFRPAFVALGGEIAAEVEFKSRVDTPYAEIVLGMQAGRPDGLVFVGGPVEVARLAQQARRLAPGLPMAAAEAAAGEALVELGGQAIEGLLVAQMHDRADTSPRYLRFHADFVARFGRAPGFHAVAAHDAVTVLADALVRRKPGETPRQAVLQHGPYQGLQQSIVFDRYGDITRALHFAVVRKGRFELLP